MSSTNRGSERSKYDYYITPIDEVVLFLNEFKKIEPHAFDGEILDAAAGGDPTHPWMSYPEAMQQVGFDMSKVTTMDIREDSLAQIKADFLTYDFGEKKYDGIICNPPFFLARPFIQKALEVVKEGGYVIMLLRLNFYGSQERKPFFDKLMPEYTLVHHRRMSFTDNKKTDSNEYCHMCYKKGYYPEFSKLKVI